MRNQLENMMRGGGMVMGMGMPPKVRKPQKPAAEEKEEKPADADVVHVGELGIPVTTAPRLQHFTRARGPRRRPPAAAAI